MPPSHPPVRTLALVLGDQLDRRYLDVLGLDRERDAVLMAEVADASRRPASHVQRTVLFLAAMRHHAEALREDGRRVVYRHLTEDGNTHSFGGELRRAIEELRPSRVACVEPGAQGVAAELAAVCSELGVPLDVSPDPHFLCSREEFSAWATGRRRLVMEHFYRMQRKRLGLLIAPDGKPEGGAWNFDKENRRRFRTAPDAPAPPGFAPDATTRQVIADVAAVLPDLPGRIDAFSWPVTREQALAALGDFVANRLPLFGDYQDAMWDGERTLYHSLIAAPLNLKLLDPREVCAAVIAAHESGRAPLNAVEGFIRQVIGWREFIRGVYWHEGPGYANRNGLEQHGALPGFYWTGDTDMACLRDAVGSVLDLAYGHHIARLMLTGNFALLAGVRPSAVNDWYLGMYADAVEWVTTPNTVGMAMHADGGVVGTKPYAASGKYIQRMSNYCGSCRYDVKRRIGEDACPFNTFYWDFLIRNRDRFRANPRMALVLKNVERLADGERTQIARHAARLRERFGVHDPVDPDRV